MVHTCSDIPFDKKPENVRVPFIVLYFKWSARRMTRARDDTVGAEEEVMDPEQCTLLRVMQVVRFDMC